ncbi:MAG: orotate phosphoribosyltransferase [Vulcanimicrobiaceae bacterium]
MRPDDFERELRARGALLEGHFRLSSGRHSERFVQKFRVLEQPALVERLGAALAAAARPYEPQVVVSAAVGGIVLGYETARALGTRAIFVEKEAGRAALRRGFALGPGERALVVEDVATTGRSIREVLEVVRAADGRPVAAGIAVRREPLDLGVPTFALLELPTVSYDPAECPACARGLPLVEPGSRYLGAARESASHG